MSTRSSITVKCRDGKFRSIYCYFNGYLSHHWPLLIEYYNNQDIAEELVNLGDMSSLDKSIECPEGHSFDNRVDGYSVFYGRDRGEENIDCLVKDSYRECFDKNNQAYNYLWDGDKWVLIVDGKPYVPSKKEIKSS